MDELDLNMCIFAGDPIEVESDIKVGNQIKQIIIGKLYPLTLRDIKNLKVTNYHQFLSLLCVNISDLKKVDGNDKNIKSTFQFLCDNCTKYNEYEILVTTALSCFFREEVKFDKDFKLFYLGDFIEHRFIDESVFEDIKNIIKLQNHMKDIEEERPIFANKKAEEMWNQIQENQKKLQDIVKKHNNLPSIISGVAWKSRIGIDRIWSLTLYQLYDACERLGLIDEYDKTLNGIYAGTVDPKAIDLKKIDWTKIINN
jgi:hypothetical protein